MSFHKRSTNERVLARHHLKRFPAAADDSSPSAHNPSPANGGLQDGLASEIIPTVPTVTPLGPVVHTTPVKPQVSVLPPIGTAKAPVSSITTGVAIVKTVSSSVSPPVVISPTSSPPQPSSSPAPSSSSSSSTPTTTSSFSSSLLAPSPTANRGVSSMPSGSAAADSSQSSRSSRGVSPGVIGAIVAILILLAVGLTAFFVRKRYLHRRAIRRNTWGAGLVPSLESRRDTVYGGQPYMGQSLPSNGGGVHQHNRLANAPAPSQMTQVTQPFGAPPASNAYTAQGVPGLSQPASSYNPAASPSPMSTFGDRSLPTPSVRSAAPSVVPMSASSLAELAIVARTFIPTLPDELHIANGEQIRIISAYDDGWALCLNSRGEQGVVPLECLEKVTDSSTEMQLQPQSEFGLESNRTSRRMSSLIPNAGGTY